MNINIEKEYKILVSKEQFDKIVEAYPNLHYRKQINTYYDSLKHSIASLHGAMRIREINNSYLFTLKLKQGNDLYEYECPIASNDESEFTSPEIKKLLTEHHLSGPFHEVGSLTTYRATLCTQWAEVCFDKNYYNDSQDYEIEYEYKKPHDGLLLFQNILRPADLVYKKNCPSKIQRAIQFLDE